MASPANDIDAAEIPGGLVTIGALKPFHQGDGEDLVRKVQLAPFRIDSIAVTNERFASFVAATGYVTEAEKFGWSFVFFDMLPAAMRTRGAVGIEWWRSVEGAMWSRPEGSGSDLAGRRDHPVTHVTWHDAVAFADWAGGRLPSEAEWVHAARGGLADPVFPWGDREPDDDAFVPCNIWQGEFPSRNKAVDGYRWTAPAKSFDPNGYGLFNMAGNTWEWTSEPWSSDADKASATTAHQPPGETPMRVMKGGSFLCHRSYCYRYRIAARHGNTPDTSTSHIGFRLVYPG